MIVSCNHIEQYYGANQVLSDLSLEIRQGDRVGLIGRNGAGKTTLFKLLTGELNPDAGQLTIRKGTKIGCLAQIPDYQDATTVYDVLARGYQEVRAWQAQMAVLERQMTLPDVYETEAKLQKVLEQYDQLREAFERAGGYEMEAHIYRIAAGLGIPEEQHGRPFASLSGGEKTKVGLGALLIEQPTLLLLDEPTNHLDMNAIEWLEQYLTSYDGTIVLISHDRYFLDQVVRKVIEIEDGEATTYYTNYTEYQVEKEERLLQQFASYQEQQKKIKKMQEAIKQLIDWGNRGNPPNPSFHRRAASMQKALDRMETLKRPILERKTMDLNLQQGDRSGKHVAVFEEVCKSFGARTLFREVSELLVYGERVFLIGDNGAGKSTLFKMLLGDVQPDRGEVRLGSRVEVGYLAQEAAPYEESKTVLHYFKEEVQMEEGQARGQLARFLFYGGDVFKAVKNLSGGEWTRLRLALLMYRKPNLLLLDEPTNHLDIASREALEEALEDFPGTLLVISHDRYFINRLAEKIWALADGKVTTYLGDFEFYKEKRIEALQRLRESDEVKAQQLGKVVPRVVQVEAPVELPAATSKGEALKKKVNPYVKEKLEKSITELETKLQQIDAELVAPMNSADAEKLSHLCIERDATQVELDTLVEQWVEMEG